MAHGVTEQWIGRVEATLIDHLKDWGEWKEENADEEWHINGHRAGHIRLEQTYKGNYHLLAEIDGKERKYVITKNKEVYAEIEKTGVANMTADRLRELEEKYMAF